MIKTKIEERTVGKETRYYPMYLHKGLFKEKWKYIPVWVYSRQDFSTFSFGIHRAEEVINNFLLDKGQCTKSTHWYPEEGE